MAIANTVSSLFPYLLLLLLFPPSIYSTITVETSRLLSGDKVQIFKLGQSSEATLKESYIPVDVSLVPLDGERVEVIGGKYRLKFLHRHRKLADITVDAIPKRKVRLVTVRRMKKDGEKKKEA